MERTGNLTHGLAKTVSHISVAQTGKPVGPIAVVDLDDEKPFDDIIFVGKDRAQDDRHLAVHQARVRIHYFQVWIVGREIVYHFQCLVLGSDRHTQLFDDNQNAVLARAIAE